MLSAAHALAMDAKNLLDVVDSVRIKFPEVNDKLIAFYTGKDVPPGDLKSPSYVSPDTAVPHEIGYVSMNSQTCQARSVVQPLPQNQVQLEGAPQPAPVPCVVSKTQIEQPIYHFATRVPPSIGPNANSTKNG